MRTLPRPITGASAELKLGGTSGVESVIGMATGVSVQDAVEESPVKVMGYLPALGHVTTDYNVSGSIDLIRIINKSIRDVKNVDGDQLYPLHDDLASVYKVLAGVKMDIIDAVDKNTVIASVHGVKITNRNVQIQRQGGGITIEQMQFVGTIVIDNTTNS